MRVLVAPGSFGATLPASDVARALAAGWSSAAPADALDLCPLPDDDLAARVAAADLVVTAEPLLDGASLLGETGRVAALAQEAGVPCLVVAGQVAVGRREAAARGVDEAYALAEEAGPAAALADPARHLPGVAARAARQWSRG